MTALPANRAALGKEGAAFTFPVMQALFFYQNASTSPVYLTHCWSQQVPGVWRHGAKTLSSPAACGSPHAARREQRAALQRNPAAGEAAAQPALGQACRPQPASPGAASRDTRSINQAERHPAPGSLSQAGGDSSSLPQCQQAWGAAVAGPTGPPRARGWESPATAVLQFSSSWFPCLFDFCAAPP